MAKILLVDDEQDLLQTVGVLLKHEGHHVTAVSTGLEATELLESMEEFDLLVTDLRMAPMDGMDVIAVARKERADLDIVVLSAYIDKETSMKVLAMGCKVCVRKPFTLDDILNPIRELIAAQDK